MVSNTDVGGVWRFVALFSGSSHVHIHMAVDGQLDAPVATPPHRSVKRNRRG